MGAPYPGLGLDGLTEQDELEDDRERPVAAVTDQAMARMHQHVRSRARICHRT